MTQPGPDGQPVYPPAAYTPAVPADLTAAPPASLIRWFSLTAVAGIPAGLLWWLLAPGGALYGSGENADTWLPRDLTLGVIGVIAGLVVAAVLFPRRRTASASAKTTAAVVGSIVGSLVAWQVGVLAGTVWGHSPANPVSDSVLFSLRSYAVLALWPGVAALATFALNLASLLRSAPGEATGSGRRAAGSKLGR